MGRLAVVLEKRTVTVHVLAVPGSSEGMGPVASYFVWKHVAHVFQGRFHNRAY